MVLLRQEIGDVLRSHRLRRGQTLRQVAAKASVALGYLSEVERGHKEASSELLNAICTALDLSLSTILVDVATVVKNHESPVLTISTLQVVETAA